MSATVILVALAFITGGGALIYVLDRQFRLDGGKLADEGTLLSIVDSTDSCDADGG